MSKLLKNIPKDRKIYGNCKVLSPDGILMFRCDKKKANWYVKRDLGEVISSDPLVVKLNFKPKGLGNHNRPFGLSDMPNKCVVCGTTEHLTRHHVVPYCYRRYLPLEMKSHNHHDVLSVCADCHEKYEEHADVLKMDISKKYNAPLNGIRTDNDIVKYRKIAATLLRDDVNIPKGRAYELRKSIKSKFNIKRLTNNRLLKISKLDSKGNITSHGEIVINKINDIQEFIISWRKHFVDKMLPQFLPEGWDVNNKI